MKRVYLLFLFICLSVYSENCIAQQYDNNAISKAADTQKTYTDLEKRCRDLEERARKVGLYYILSIISVLVASYLFVLYHKRVLLVHRLQQVQIKLQTLQFQNIFLTRINATKQSLLLSDETVLRSNAYLT